MSGPYGDLALSPLSLFPGLCFLVRVVRVPPGHRLHFPLGPWTSVRSSFLFRRVAWQFRLARSMKPAFALSGPIVSGSQGPVPVSQCPLLRPQVASASVHCRQVSVRAPASACAFLASAATCLPFSPLAPRSVIQLCFASHTAH